MTRKHLSCTEETAHSSKQNAAKEEVKATKSADIIISGDGMWKTRGQTSRLGICARNGDKTGKKYLTLKFCHHIAHLVTRGKKKQAQNSIKIG